MRGRGLADTGGSDECGQRVRWRGHEERDFHFPARSDGGLKLTHAVHGLGISSLTVTVQCAYTQIDATKFIF